MRIAPSGNVLIALLAAGSLATGSCSRSIGNEAIEKGTTDSPRSPTVFTVNGPLCYLAGRIASRSRITVHFPAPPSVDPAFWMPDEATISRFQGADLVLLNGAGYASWTDKVSLAPSRLVDTSAGFRDRLIAIDDEVTHAHGPGGEHAYRATAFTTWLDLGLAGEQARAIETAFSRRWPDEAATFRAQLAGLERDLLALDGELERICSGSAEHPLLASHPVYQYLARRYGLNLRSVHWEPDEIPSPDMWEELEGILKRHPAKWMLFEAEPLAIIYQRLGGLGVRVAIIEPGGNPPREGDFLEVLRRNVEEIRRVFAQEPG